MSWPPGTVVVCIADDWVNIEPGIDPVKGQYYTTDGTAEMSKPKGLYVWIGLKEILLRPSGERRMYASANFRVAESKTNEVVTEYAKVKA